MFLYIFWENIRGIKLWNEKVQTLGVIGKDNYH
jgi:hypothetical protein